MALTLTEDEVQNCSWTLVEQTPEYRRYIGHGTHPVTDVPITVQKTEYLAEPDLLKLNAESRNDTDGTRWSKLGDRNGVDLVRVASIPMNVFMRDFAGRLREGDRDFGKWWLNHDANQMFRTRRGRV